MNLQTNSDALKPSAGLFSELETSLHASQQALLSRNVARLEHLTSEQEGLRLRLMALLDEHTRRPIDSCLPAPCLELAARVCFLGKVQSALLARAEHALRVLSHGMAGTQADYSRLPSEPAASQRALWRR